MDRMEAEGAHEEEWKTVAGTSGRSEMNKDKFIVEAVAWGSSVDL